MTTNISNLLDKARERTKADKDDWYAYLDNPQSINQSFFIGHKNLSLDLFTLTKIYHVVMANFARALAKTKDDVALLKRIKEITYSYEGLIEWLETFISSRDLRVEGHYELKAVNFLHSMTAGDYYCLSKLEQKKGE